MYEPEKILGYSMAFMPKSISPAFVFEQNPLTFKRVYSWYDHATDFYEEVYDRYVRWEYHNFLRDNALPDKNAKRG
jgi:hypothetical protein